MQNIIVVAALSLFASSAAASEQKQNWCQVRQVADSADMELQSSKLLGEHTNLRIEYLMPIKLDISASGINRINVGGGNGTGSSAGTNSSGRRIIKIVGDSAKFKAHLSDTGEHLFLVSGEGAGKVINLSLVMADGEVLDLALAVKNQQSPAFVNLARQNIASDVAKLKDEIFKMIEAMSAGETGKYYVETAKHNLSLPSHLALRLKGRWKGVYRYENLTGYILSLKNMHSRFAKDQRSKSYRLDKEFFSQIFKGLLATAASQEILAPGAETKVFVVLDNKNGQR